MTSQMSINSEDKYLQIFAKHRHYYDFFIKAGEIVNFNHDVQSELLEAYRNKVDQYYHYTNTCPACVAEFLINCYKWYDKQNV